MSQAPGLLGTPDRGHRSSAATRASWASSSARPTSRTILARPAMRRADSILQTASIAGWASAAVTAADQIIFNPSLQGGGGRGDDRGVPEPPQPVAPLLPCRRK